MYSAHVQPKCFSIMVTSPSRPTAYEFLSLAKTFLDIIGAKAEYVVPYFQRLNFTQ